MFLFPRTVIKGFLSSKKIASFLEFCLIKVNGSFVPYLNKTNEGPEEKFPD